MIKILFSPVAQYSDFPSTAACTAKTIQGTVRLPCVFVLLPHTRSSFILPALGMTLESLSPLEASVVCKCDESGALHGLKRKRSIPITPPTSIDDPEAQRTLSCAVHVLSTEATALSFITKVYQTDPAARNELLKAVDTIVRVNDAHGKLIVCGVGKSGYIGMKIAATMKSLGLASSFLHPTEAMHGDLGDIQSVRALLPSDHGPANDVRE